MNIILWMLAGGAAGWIGCSAFHVNESRGLVISAMIGVAGAFFGGHVLVPVFGGTTGNPGDFSVFALLVALATAVGCLSISDMMYKRFEI